MQQLYQHALPIGTRLESYEIQGVLGVGGFGITYKAYDHTLQCSVAIKEYLPSVFAVRTPDGSTVSPKSERDEEPYGYGLTRFLDEARLLAKFRESNIVRVVRFLEANHTAYLVMDYEDGESLSARLKREISLDEDQIRNIMIPLLDSLRAVHAKQYLHRDIKPSNIYLRADESPVLLDFGSARQALNQQARAMTGMVTPGYAPIEQYFADTKQGPWTDIYALGATAYHCATGIAPVIATERLSAIQDGEPDPVDKIQEFLEDRFSRAFLDAMTWMLRPAAKDRPQDVDEAIEALKKSAGSRPAQEPNATTAPMPDGAQAGWQAEILNAVEVTLQHYIGPISKVLIRKAAAKTSNVDELTQLLATFLTTEQHKTAFLAQTRMLTQPASSATLAPTAPEPPPPVSTTSTTYPTGNEVFTSEQLKQAEVRLAAYLGPFARVLVKKASQRASNLDELYQLLAGDLDDEKQQQQFLTPVKVHLRRPRR